MSDRIRGVEISLLFSVEGVPQVGSFTQVEEFEVTPEQDLPKTDFIGEEVSDRDFRHDGFDGSFSIHNSDLSALAFLDTVIERDRAHRRHPDITCQVMYRFRDPSVPTQLVVYHEMFVKIDSESFRGRKEYVTTKFSWTAKWRERTRAPV